MGTVWNVFKFKAACDSLPESGLTTVLERQFIVPDIGYGHEI
jgi:hypothetical protein